MIDIDAREAAVYHEQLFATVVIDVCRTHNVRPPILFDDAVSLPASELGMSCEGGENQTGGEAAKAKLPHGRRLPFFSSLLIGAVARAIAGTRNDPPWAMILAILGQAMRPDAYHP